MNTANISEISTQIISFCAGVGAVILTVHLVWTAARAQTDISLGRPTALAGALEEVVALVVCFGFLVSSQSIGADVAVVVTNVAVTNGQGLVEMSRGVGSILVRGLILISGSAITLGAVSSGVSTQFALMLGLPGSAGESAARIVMVILSGSLTLIALMIANAVIAAAH